MAAVRTGLLALLALAITGLASGDAFARGGSHPYFNDGGALRWYHSYADAQRAAQREGKLIFIESGRPNCGLCAKLCSSVLAHRNVRGRIGRVAVGLVSNCDRMEPVVARLFRQNLHRPSVLPLIGFVTPRGRWVNGFYGSRSLAQFTADMDTATRALRRVRTSRAAPSSPAPRPVQPATPPTPSCPPVYVAPRDRAPALPAPSADCRDEACPGGTCDIESCPGGTCPGGNCSVDPEDPCAGFAPPALEEAPATTQPPHRETLPPRVTDATPPKASNPAGLPAPRVRAVERRPLSSADLGMPREASGSPDGDIGLRPAATPTARPRGDTPLRPASTSVPVARRKADEAAARGQWGVVLRLTADIPELSKHADQARRWARDTLETSVRLLLGKRLEPARKALEAVATEFEGFPASIDAERGLEALGLIEELRYLSKDSIVRTSVRARAHERMRGSRWACLFREAR